MDSAVKLIQGNYCCRYQGKMLYVTEQGSLLAGLEPQSGKIEIFQAEPLKNRIYKLMVVDNAVYAVDIKGYWIAELVMGETKYRYYETGCHKTDIGNEAFICVWNKKIHLFANDGAEVTVFDTATKKICKDRIGLWEKGKTPRFDCGFLEKDDFTWLFSGSMKLVIKYDMRKKEIVDTHSLPQSEQVMFACRFGESILVLCANTVYQIGRKTEALFTVPETEPLTKLCLTEKNIWVLPGDGEHIYLYDLETGRYEKYNDYPLDFQYDIPKGWGKYTSYCEDENAYYWVMRSNNYFLRIDKETGLGTWIYPQNIKKEYLLKRYYIEGKKTISEKILPLDEYLEWIMLL